MSDTRCSWAVHTEMEKAYHDAEWGVPTKNDKTLFEFLILEAAQAGLSWRTVLEKREAYQKYYKNFEVQQVANFNDEYLEEMLLDPAIIRNRLKVYASVKNAKVFILIQQEFGSFARYLWQFVHNKPLQNKVDNYQDIPAETDISKQLSKDLKKRGMSFVGPTIMYAYMQAVGLVNDHSIDCICFEQCQQLGTAFQID